MTAAATSTKPRRKTTTPATLEVMPAQRSILDTITKIARNKDIDVERLRDLMNLRREIETEEARRAFNDALHAAQAEMPLVTANALNSHTNSRYAKLDVMSRAMQPVIEKHGFAITFSTEQSPIDQHIRITGVLIHRAGYERIGYYVDLPLDLAGAQGKTNKNPVQASGSTITYGRRYLKGLMFDLAVTEDDDGVGAFQSDERINEKEFAILSKRITEVGADEAKFCAMLGVEQLEDLAVDRFDFAMAKLDQKARFAAAKAAQEKQKESA